MSPHDPNERVQVLLVEDNPADVRLTQEAVRDRNLPLDLHVVHDGVQAMDFLYRCQHSEGAITPDLVLLDLNMPRKDGKEVLEEMKADPELGKLPVVILSTAGPEKDVLALCDSQRDRYYMKPANLDEFLELIQDAYQFWQRVVRRTAS